MISSLFRKLNLAIALRLLTTLFIVFVAGCGGGGKTGSSSSAPGITLQIVDGSGNSVTSMLIGTTYKLRATATDSNGLASNVIVTMTAPGGIAILSPSSGSALTNSSGVANVDILPSSVGAAQASVTASVTLVTKSAAGVSTSSLTTVTGTLNYSVAVATLTLGTLNATSASIASAGNTGVYIDVFSNGALATASTVSVGYTTTCGQMSPTIATTNGSGRASSTYNSIASDGTLCQGNATITATVSGTTATKVIAVAAPTTGVVNFISAVPRQIYLATSGASSQSILTFKVLSSGVAQAALPVKLTLESHPGGVTFGTLGNTSSVTINSDAAGLVPVTVFAGGTPGAVTIKAEWVSDSNIYATSNNFTIAQGPAQQGRLSISTDKSNIEGWLIDGETVVLTASVADANGNPAPAGTVVNFVAQGGQIASSCTTVLSSAGISQCSVSFISQSPRPANGRVAILAYLEGIKQYTDNNANNQFDAGDVAVDQGDAYRDDNEDGLYTPGEFVVSRGGMVACASGTDAGAPSRANTCTGTTVGATTVRTQVRLLFSTNTPVVTIPAGQGPYTGGLTAATMNIRLNGNGTAGNLLPLPERTTVIAESLKTGCSASDLNPATVGRVGAGSNPTANIGSLHSITLTGTATVNCSGGLLRIKTTTPSGVENQVSVTIP